MPIRHLLLFLGLILITLAALADDRMEIFELKGRTPQEMIPLLQPFVGPDGSVSGMHNSLIVRTSPQRMEEIRRIIGEFDRAPRRLLIHVRESAPSNGAGNEIGINAGNRHIHIGERDKQGLTLKRYTTRTHEESVRSVQTLEGEPVLILNGVSLPVATSSGYVAGAGPGSHQITYGYRDVDSGFYAIANLVGDRVRVEITSRREHPVPGAGAIDRQESRNMVTGRIGEWLHIAGIRSSRRNDTMAIARQSGAQSESSSDLWLKVEVLE